MSQLLSFPLHLNISRKETCFLFIETFFRCVHFRNVLVLVRLINTLKTRQLMT